MSPIVCEMKAELDAAPERVWKVVTDWDHLHEWMTELSGIRLLTEQRQGVGVEAEATIRVGGITTRDRVRVSVWEPGRRLVVDHLGWVSGWGEMLLTAMDDGRTYFVWIEGLVPPLGPLGAIGLRIYRPLLQRTFDRDLRLLQDYVRRA